MHRCGVKSTPKNEILLSPESQAFADEVIVKVVLSNLSTRAWWVLEHEE